MKIILFGPPAAGKGTQAEIISREYNVSHISTGDILRAAVKEGTELGVLAQSYMEKGELVPDDVVIGIINEVLIKSDSGNGFMLDGFPRTIPQAEALDEALNKANMGIDAVISIEVKDEEILVRIENRQKIEGRKDDSVEVAKNRLEVYRNQTEPLKDYYSNANKLMEVDGLGKIDEVFDRIKTVLDSIIGHN